MRSKPPESSRQPSEGGQTFAEAERWRLTTVTAAMLLGSQSKRRDYSFGDQVRGAAPFSISLDNSWRLVSKPSDARTDDEMARSRGAGRPRPAVFWLGNQMVLRVSRERDPADVLLHTEPFVGHIDHMHSAHALPKFVVGKAQAYPIIPSKSASDQPEGSNGSWPVTMDIFITEDADHEFRGGVATLSFYGKSYDDVPAMLEAVKGFAFTDTDASEAGPKSRAGSGG
ncbi:MAG: hypothetical protein HYR64_05505 [Fimbriimonas ginsengisoli]|uniref:Uncharacterized protein n=1 Tax=Fimbriimonas ginsengisoli TaxID=1005039 RepID=A0A931LSA1_FIMGI|nr:hypothetical protein [Fimbriimonas ginsengisoli]